MSPELRRLYESSGLAGRTKRTTILAYFLLTSLARGALFVLGAESMRGRGLDPATLGAIAAPLPWVSAALGLLLLWLVVRRFHDQNRPGWLALVPYGVGLVAWIVPVPAELVFAVLIGWLVALFLPPTVGPNRYGPDPRGWRSRDHYEQERRLGRAT